MRLTLVVNPAATGVARLRAVVSDALGAEHEVVVAETAARGDATGLAARAAAAGADVVVSLGGDGTANEVANGLVGTGTALAALPGGSTNVFARTIGFPNRTEQATEVLLAALARGSRSRVGLGAVGNRRFLFHAGIGFDARVIEMVERHSWAKHRVGPLAFAGAGLATWLGTADHPSFTVHAGDEAIDGRFAIVQNSDPYTYLGPRPLTVAPEAGLGRPLAVAVFGDLGAATLVPAICSALAGGRRLRELPGVVVRDGLDRLTVDAAAAIGHQVDGDFLGETSRIQISHDPECLDLVMP